MIQTKKIHAVIFYLWASFLLLSGCTPQAGTDTGNATSLAIKFVGQTSGVTLTEARIVLKEIDLDPIALCQAEEETAAEEAEPEFDFVGPFVVDLLNNTSVPDTDTVQIPSGTYCEIELNFDRLEMADVPNGISPDDPIVEQALLIRGSRDDGTPFLVRLKEDDRFRLEASSPDGFAIEGGNGATQFFVSFDLSTWFLGVDLDNAVLSDGMIFIDHENNAPLRALIVENVKQSARLFRDLNGNGVLDEDESDDTLVLGEGVDEAD